MADADATIDLARAEPFRLGALEVDPPRRRVSTGETLEPRVMQVLVALARANGAVVSRDELIRTCWDGRIVGEDSITRVIGRLRKLAEEQGGGAFAIETVPKVGYRLAGTVAPLVRPQAPAEPHAGAKAPYIRPALIVAAILMLVFAGFGLIRWLRPAPDLATMHFAGFRALGNVPPGLTGQIDESVISGFSEDSEIGIRRGAADTGPTLSGTVARDGDTLRISARIENAATGTALWSRTFVQPVALEDRVPDWLASRTTFIARCGLSQAATYGKPLSDQVMALVFATCDSGHTDGDGRERTIDLARRLTVAQPDFAYGWASLAFLAAPDRQSPRGAPGSVGRPEADAALAKALALDPQNTLAWHAEVYQVPKTDFVAIDAAFRRALAARPSFCGCVYHDYAYFLRGMGRSREALQMVERQRDLAPLEPGVYAARAQMYAGYGRLGEARQDLARATTLELDPHVTQSVLVSNAIWLKDYRGALTALDQEPMKGPPALAEAIKAGFRALDSGDAATRLAAAHEVGKQAAACNCVSSFSIRMQAALGDAQGALDALNAAAPKFPPPFLGTITWDPVLADVRGLPGYASLVERIGLIRYWRATKTKPDFCANANAPPVCATI